MISIQQRRTQITNLDLTEEEAREVTLKYLEDVVLQGRYINKDGMLEHWTSYPHGSGTTTLHGKATAKQKLASDLVSKMRGV